MTKPKVGRLSRAEESLLNAYSNNRWCSLEELCNLLNRKESQINKYLNKKDVELETIPLETSVELPPPPTIKLPSKINKNLFGRREGIAIMTQEASVTIDEIKKSEVPTNLTRKDCIFRQEE